MPKNNLKKSYVNVLLFNLNFVSLQELNYMKMYSTNLKNTKGTIC